MQQLIEWMEAKCTSDDIKFPTFITILAKAKQLQSEHGWKSKRAELGVMCREEIKLVKEQLQKEEPKTYTQEQMRIAYNSESNLPFSEWISKYF